MSRVQRVTCLVTLNQYMIPLSLPEGSVCRQAFTGQHVVTHEGAVTAILPTPDGLFWVTAGSDSRVRLWDCSTHRSSGYSDLFFKSINQPTGCQSTCRNKLVNYERTFNRATKVWLLLYMSQCVATIYLLS